MNDNTEYEYAVVIGYTPQMLVDEMKPFREDGWKCQGGVSVCYGGIVAKQYQYAQAVIRPIVNMHKLLLDLLLRKGSEMNIYELEKRMNEETECTCRERDEARPRFVDHAGNNFMEALATLKEEFEHRCQENNDQDRIDELDKLIAKLEEVK